MIGSFLSLTIVLFLILNFITMAASQVDFKTSFKLQNAAFVTEFIRIQTALALELSRAQNCNVYVYDSANIFANSTFEHHTDPTSRRTINYYSTVTCDNLLRRGVIGGAANKTLSKPNFIVHLDMCNIKYSSDPYGVYVNHNKNVGDFC